MLLQMLPITFRGAAKDWLKALPTRAIKTWEKLHEKVIQEFIPPSKVAKLIKKIANFEQHG